MADPLLRRRLARVALSALLLLPAACSDGPAAPRDRDEEPPAVQPTGPVSATIGRAGGTVEVVAANGTRLTLSVPADALTGDVELTLRPQSAVGARAVQVALEPEGLFFLKPLDITVVLPQSVAMTDMQLVLGSADAPITLATGRNDAARTLRTLALSSFGVIELQIDDDDADAGSAALRWSGGSNVLSAQGQTCQQVLDGARQRFDQALASRRFGDVYAAMLHVGGALVQNGCDIDVQRWMDEASAALCPAYNDLLDDIRQSPVTEYGDFNALMQQLLTVEALDQRLNSVCRPEWRAVMSDKADDFIQFATDRANRIIVPDYAAFVNLRNDARTIFLLMLKANLTGVTEFSDRLQTDALHPTMDMARAVAYRLCADGVWHYPLSRLTSLGFFARRDIIGVAEPRPTVIAPSLYARYEDADLFSDIQYCGTRLDISAHVVSGGQLSTVTGGSLGAPGAFTEDVELEVPTRGTVQLDGDLQAITCWNNVQRDQQIIISLDGREARTLSRTADRYLDGPLELEIDELAKAAGVTPKEGNASTLRIRRPAVACPDELYGSDDFTLLTALVRWKNPTLRVNVSLSNVAGSSDEVNVEVRAAVVDQHGEPGYFDDIAIDLEVEGGTADQATGMTDEDGYFRTVVRMPSSPHGGSSGVSVTATATSFEEVTAQGFATTMGVCPAPPSWAVARIHDESGVGPGSGSSSLDGPNLTYLSVAGSARVTSNSEDAWSPTAGFTAYAEDYVRFVPLVANPGSVGPLYARVHGSGFAEARATGSNCCGPNGNGRADVSMSSRWLYDGSDMIRLEAFAGASWNSEYGSYERNTLDVTVTTPLLAGHLIEEWLDMRTTLTGGTRHRGQGETASIAAQLQMTVLDIVDQSGASVPTLICSAAGFNYGAPQGGASRGVTASRPLHQMR